MNLLKQDQLVNLLICTHSTTSLVHFHVYVWLHSQTYKIFFKESGNMLIEVEMESALAEIPGRQIKRLEK
jgi:hypothetical protein